MKYRFPKISNTLSYKRIDKDTVEVTDHLTDNSFDFGIEVARYIRKLDGRTHPYRIQSIFDKEEINDILNFLDENDLIRKSKTINVSFGTKLRTLWVPKRSVILMLLAYLLNLILMLSWIPVLIIGIKLFTDNLLYMEFNYIWTGYFIGLLCGMFFHELGHAFAGISYGARVFEMGVMVMYCILPGAYVLLDRSPVKKRYQRIQINAAGVEANFFLCGLFLIAGAVVPQLGGMFLNAAICNAFIGALNLTFIKGLDGSAVLSDLIGVESFVEKSHNVLISKRERRKLIKNGVSGYATLMVCFLISAIQIALPVLLITNVLEVITCFV